MYDITYVLMSEIKKYIQMNLFIKLKWTHRDQGRGRVVETDRLGVWD